MEGRNMQFVGHLEELRNRLILTAITFIGFLIGAFIFVTPIYQWLIRDLDTRLVVLSPGEILWVYMMLAAVIALAATIPVAAFQVWRFVAPALKMEERKVTLQYIPALFFLFLAGLAFGYFLVFPLVLGFLSSLSAGQFDMMFTADKYFRFMLNLTVPFGLLFEMPLVVLFLTRLGILKPARLKQVRKAAYFALVVTSILITPPDLVSDVLVAVPLLLLYEISINLSEFVYQKRLKKEKLTNESAAS